MFDLGGFVKILENFGRFQKMFTQYFGGLSMMLADFGRFGRTLLDLG